MHEDIEQHRIVLRSAKERGLLGRVPADPLKRRIIAAVHTSQTWQAVSKKVGLPAMKAKYLYDVTIAEVIKAERSLTK